MAAEKSKAKDKLKEMTIAHYGLPKTVDRKLYPVAWCASIVPVEFLRAMDVLPLFPENHSAMIGAAKMGTELAEVAEAEGYSTDICSYARSDIGHVLAGKSPIGGLAKPDFLVSCNNICSTVTKWYENLAQIFDVPLYMIDTPFNHGRELPEYAVQYVKTQLEEFIPWLEEVTGKKFDMDRFYEVAKISNQTSQLWRKVLEYGKHKPSPYTGFDTFNFMLPAVTMRGTFEALEYYRILRAELERKVKEDMAAIPDEKYRLLFNGIPVWYALRPMAELLAKYKANIVCTTYTSAWVMEFDLNNLLESMAKVYMKVIINQSIHLKIEDAFKLIEEYSLDGVLQHSNRSCKPYCFGIYDLSRAIQESDYSIPTLIFDGDQTDSRNFSWAQFENRFQSFIETLESLR